MKIKTYDKVLPAPHKALTIHNSDDDIIVQYLQGNMDDRYKPSKKIQDKIDDMKTCHQVYKRHGSRRKTVNLLVQMEGWSEKKAYLVFNRMNKIYPVVTHHDQKINLDILLEQIQELYNQASDDKVKAQLLKQKGELIRDQMGSANVSLYERIQPPKVILGYFPEQLKTDLSDKSTEEKMKIVEKFKTAKRKKVEFEDAKIVGDAE